MVESENEVAVACTTGRQTSTLVLAGNDFHCNGDRFGAAKTGELVLKRSVGT